MIDLRNIVFWAIVVPLVSVSVYVVILHIADFLARFCNV